MKTLNYSSYTELIRMVKIIRFCCPRGLGLTSLLFKELLNNKKKLPLSFGPYIIFSECFFFFILKVLFIIYYTKSGSRHKNWCMAWVLNFLKRYFSNYYILHRSDLAAWAAPLDPRLYTSESWYSSKRKRTGSRQTRLVREFWYGI